MGLSTTNVQPAVTDVDIDELTLARAGMEAFELDGLPLQPEPLRARRVIVRLASATVAYHRTNVRLRTRSSPQPGLLAFSALGPKARGTAEGIPLRPGMLFVTAPDRETGFVVDPGYESVALLVSPETVRMHFGSRSCKREFHSPRRLEVPQVDPARARALFARGKRLAMTASRNPQRFEPGRPERDAAEAALLDALISTLLSADGNEPLEHEKARRSHARIVAIAEQLVLSHPGERVLVSDLCLVADVSERTLECVFKDVVGVSPHAYLTRLRLQQVRNALLRAAPGSTQVSTEALKWGFGHFGEFSSAYKRCFGELPSHTLRRAHSGNGLSSNTVAASGALNFTMRDV